MPKFSLNTRDKRKKLAVRDAPYYQTVAKGMAVGYRKGLLLSTWSLRRFNGKKYSKREIGQADDTTPADGVGVLPWNDVRNPANSGPAQAAALAARYTVAQRV